MKSFKNSIKQISYEQMYIVNLFFSDYFDVDPDVIDEYGAFNISLINDLPLFIDPFLLFNSGREDYQELHDGIIRYLRFLRNKSLAGAVNRDLVRYWYTFREVKQNWLGFSREGNDGSGLGVDFAYALNANLVRVFSNFGNEKITRGSHLEKLCLIQGGVGRDNISDFTTNLIKGYLLDYTQKFALENINSDLRSKFPVRRARFNFETESWEMRTYELPDFDGDYVLLTPIDMLTKDEIWINRNDMIKQFQNIEASISDGELRAALNNYLYKVIPEGASEKEVNTVKANAYWEFPQLLEYFIKYKEDHGDEAKILSETKVEESKFIYHEQVSGFITILADQTMFYGVKGDTLEEARSRVMYMKHVIEDQDGYRLFFVDDTPVRRESDLHLLFKLVWCSTPSNIDAEVNNGRGPVDFKSSRGRFDSTLVEFKLASNTQLKRNLEKQLPIYEAANATKKKLSVIVYFTPQELLKVRGILEELKLIGSENIILIDARADNKPSGSMA